jgi:hypothetical protein
MLHLLLLLLLDPAFGAEDRIAHFEAKVRPVLARHCYSCHGPGKQFSGLRVDSRESLIQGGKRGAAIEPGRPSESLLVRAIRQEGLKMPVGSRLADAEIRAIEQWIRDGAPWPAGAVTGAPSPRSHWAFEPVRQPPAPQVRQRGWPVNDIDRFVLAALEKSSLSPASPAGRTTLIRRLSFVLTGLPPRWEDVERFVSDRSPDAYESLVDRLLASPHYGEHWARHWMDLARYGETRGYEWNYEIVGAWRYRDYLIRAFNSDVPYDQFVREHIAGDLLEQPRINAAEGIYESKIATAFHRLGEAGHDDCIQFREISTDVIDNQIDTLSKTFQGLTVACARCHDHKLDPIPTGDYYGVYGIFSSSRPVVHTLDLPAVHALAKQRLRDGKETLRRELAAMWIEALPRIVLPAADEKTPIESPAYPLSLRKRATPSEFTAAWKVLASRYRMEEASRAAFNRENFTAFGDFRKGFGNWFADGAALGEGPQPSGDFAIALEGKTVIRGIYPAGVFTHTLSDKFNAALRSPYLPKDKKYLSVRVMGGKLGARRTVIDNCAIGEQYKTLENETLEWVRLDTYAKEERLPVYFEMVTKTDNPRIPDRPGMLKGYTEQEITSSPRSYFGIVSAVVHDLDAAPKEDLGHMLALFETTPANEEELKGIYVRTLRRALERWAAGQASDHDAIWLDWAVRSGVLPNGVEASPRLQELVAAYRAAEAAVPAPRTVEGLADQGGTFDVPVFLSGDPKNPGPITPRHFLSLLGDRKFQTGSGRRELAELIASPANPLTARVMVNRIWHHLFGRGLVKTTDNFGSIADPPTHPELLDYLASRFMSEGWSVKKLIREIVLSSTFRQSGSTSAAAAGADPQNLLLHHYPLRRLPAESIRDAILSASGRLERKLYGPGADPHRPEPQDYRRLFSGPLDGGGRRSIYTRITRMEGPKFLEIFDYPPPLATRGERDVTNVPAQALALLNDPFVTAQAEEWAAQLIRGGGTIEQKVTEMFRGALGRDPSAAELERFRGLALEVARLGAAPQSDLLTSRAVWKDVAHAVFNLKEFVYVQ